MTGAVGLGIRFLNVLVLRPMDQSCTDVDGCFKINGDALYSHLQGELLAQGHGFASSFSYWLFGEVQPGAGDPPGYPLYLGLVSALHGSGSAAAFAVALATLVVLVLATWAVTRSLRGPRAARLALLLGGGLALLLLAVSSLPGIGADQRGVVAGGDSVSVLPGGESVAVASIDTSAVVSHRLASSMVGAIGVVLIAIVGRRVAGARAGIIAGGVAALYPMLWINDGMVLSESLYVPLIAAVILAAYWFWDRPEILTASVLGLACAVAATARAEAVFLLPLLFVPLSAGVWRRLGLPAAVRSVLSGGVAAALLLVPWMGYNFMRFEESALMTSQTGAVLSAGSCDVAYHGEHVGYYGANCFEQYVDSGWTSWPDTRAEESVRDVPPREGAIRYIRENLSELPRVMVFRIGRMWDLYKPGQNVALNYNVEGRGRIASWAGLVFYVFLLPLAAWGVWVLWRRRIPVSPLLSQAAMVTITAALTFGVTRYRVPADVSLVVAAAVGFDQALRMRVPVHDDGSVSPRPPRRDA